MYLVQLTIDEHTDVAETLISLRHGQRASLAEIVRIVGPRLDLNDYAAYNLPKQILEKATNLMIPSSQTIDVSKYAKRYNTKQCGAGSYLLNRLKFEYKNKRYSIDEFYKRKKKRRK
ncbi:unnamed protein product [Rotaria magnacalcarata]|uniref:Uncharacterized protein n=1 Tax=Rotaria magnacalcarata TaxID=392030 RepID=A0A816MU70_9BILA|nr:unnamed protein product [Rotaria magnacalcarata]CAF4013928.1 unnamed protein product [Rotaria magnacalcarata]CAF5100531.1 unnamed protein product [Rotaria magnacalcarata]